MSARAIAPTVNLDDIDALVHAIEMRIEIMLMLADEFDRNIRTISKEVGFPISSTGRYEELGFQQLEVLDAVAALRKALPA